ncbi:DoxX family protein [Marivita sp.]|uniref:DoxX family protein n=1 Tax=Marivita sp. TaxID=2003365 RepID=UPI003B526720
MSIDPANSKSDLAAFILRITSGAAFLAHGWLKVSVFTIPGTVGFFESLGLPGFFAYLTILAELGGGLALILGVAVRAVSIPLIEVPRVYRRVFYSKPMRRYQGRSCLHRMRPPFPVAADGRLRHVAARCCTN